MVNGGTLHYPVRNRGICRYYTESHGHIQGLLDSCNILGHTSPMKHLHYQPAQLKTLHIFQELKTRFFLRIRTETRKVWRKNYYHDLTKE